MLVDRESVDLAHDDIWVDVVRFDDLLAECKTHGHPESEVCAECLPPLTEAVELYRDDFMAGFGLRDSVAFDDWQFFQSESLRRELAGALERLARGRGALGEWEAAIAHARRWLALDILHEPAHRLLMTLYAWSDQRAAALRQYRECVRILGPGARRRPARGDDPALQGHTGERPAATSGPLRARSGGSAGGGRLGPDPDHRATVAGEPAGGTRARVGGAARGLRVHRGGGPRRRPRRRGRHRQDQARRGVRGRTCAREVRPPSSRAATRARRTWPTGLS